MTPDEIKAFVEANYKDIVATERNSPDGWAFWYGSVQRGHYSTRLARALDDSAGSRFKLAISSRLEGDDIIRRPTSTDELRALIDNELRLYKQHFKG